MAKGLQWIGWAMLGIIGMMVTGCARHTVYVPLEPPITQPETAVEQDGTLMEAYQEVVGLYDAEKTRALALEKSLAEKAEACKRAEAEAQALKDRVTALEADLLAKADLEQKYTETCEELVTLSKTVPDLQRKLLSEQLTRIKHEQTIVALKIEGAMNRRRQMLEAGASVKDMSSQDGDVTKETHDANL